VWIVIPSIYVGVFSKEYLGDDQIKSRRGETLAHLDQAKSAKAYATVVTTTFSFQLSSGSSSVQTFSIHRDLFSDSLMRWQCQDRGVQNRYKDTGGGSAKLGVSGKKGRVGIWER
jgi:hypothetical protein